MTKASEINARVALLRQWMREQGIGAFIFPSTDPHAGEYVPDHWKAREWISGFNGSAGTAVVTLTRAALWTDSRYWLAAEEQTAGTPFEVIRCGRNEATAEELVEWIAGSEEGGMASGKPEAESGLLVGFDNEVVAEAYARRLQATLLRYGRGCIYRDPCAELWTDRPALPASPIAIQPFELAGRSAADKLADIRAALKSNDTDAVLITQLDEIAWTLNLRGNDVHCTPVFVAYLFVMPERAILYVDPAKVTAEVEAHLSEAKVELRPYEDAGLYADEMEEEWHLQLDLSTVNASLYRAGAVDMPSPVSPLRAIKNAAEQAGFRSAMLKDGVAMVKFLRQINELTLNGLTEVGVDRLLTGIRAEQEGFRDISFDTIAGYGAHAAIVHYEATPETDIALEPHGLLLLDSGAQYVDGTTDITRTIPLGPLTEDERHDYTLVLKGHIRLASAVFPEGTTGTQLDVLARYAMWQEHKNYGHGTGHGVGSYLSVHEGPHQFRMNYVPAPLRAGMTVTIEPGIYIAGSHGVRIENTMLIVDSPSTGRAGEGRWLRLEPLTLCPISTAPIVREMMTADEIEYLNNYHMRVREALMPLLSDEADRTWLTQATAPL